MSRNASTSIATTSLGFWIWCAVAGFTAGYPMLLFAALEQHRLLPVAAMFFGSAALLTASGFRWARIGYVVLCLCAVLFFVRALLLTLQFGIGPPSIAMLVVFVPLAGYSTSVGLLCTSAMKNWQAESREARRRRLLAENSATQLAIESAGLNKRLEICPWCDAPAVDPSQERCLACNRPVG